MHHARKLLNTVKRPSPELLNELVRRIVDAVHPLRIILFGSAARGDMGPHSDLDVLVVLRDGTQTTHAENEIYRRMWGFGFAKDIIVVTEDDVRRHASNPYLVIHTALTQGKDLYHAVG
ncbi:MAG: nucleotidyltransferase domain-containing protein [Planctomycetes bacterium]|nr:nucleotidyltransferase domain-containing protein [Planctomycetota bacterium]MCH8963860.1 nucleotidyltransferase domain-containing protein [Planctomycetota bacterium]